MLSLGRERLAALREEDPKNDPYLYGEKLSINLSTTVNIRDALQEAKARCALPEQPRDITEQIPDALPTQRNTDIRETHDKPNHHSDALPLNYDIKGILDET